MLSTINFLLSFAAWQYYSYAFPLLRSNALIAFYLVLTVNTVVCYTFPSALPSFISRISAWTSGYWIAYLYYSLMLMLVHGISYGVFRVLKISLPYEKFVSYGLVMLVLFIVWGSWHAFNPVIRTETILTSKFSEGSSYKIILLSDLHLGRELGYKYSEGLVKLVNQQEPDLVLIAGDIVDEKIEYVEDENSLMPLKRINAPLGVVGIFGNHDYFDKPNKLKVLLEENKVKILTDETKWINEKLKITGLRDYHIEPGTQALEKLSVDNQKYYSILLDHQPRRIDEAAQAGYDLYLAGHTHTGQLFPNRLITRKMYKLDYGLKKIDDFTAVVSNGYGFWGPAVRTEVRPEIVVINICGQKSPSV